MAALAGLVAAPCDGRAPSARTGVERMRVLLKIRTVSPTFHDLSSHIIREVRAALPKRDYNNLVACCYSENL